MGDIPGIKNLRLLAQQPVAIANLAIMKAIGGAGTLEKRYVLELTFESNRVFNVPLTQALYEALLDELKHQEGVGVEQRMAARGAIASAGAETKAVREQVLPLDATGKQVYEALREVTGRVTSKESNLLEEGQAHDGPGDDPSDE